MLGRGGHLITQRDVNDLIDKLQSSGQLEGLGRLRDFMRCCCRALSQILPPEAEQWLKVADKYRNGNLPASELLAARLEAWQLLGANSCDFNSRQVNGVRAVLFLLFPDDHQDFRDIPFVLGEFISFCTDAGMAVEEQFRCLTAAYEVPSA